MANEETTNTQAGTATNNTVVVPTLEPGQKVTITLDADQVPQLNFDAGTESTQEFVGNDLVFTLDNGAVLTFEDFAANINDGDVTSIMLADGSIIPIDALIAAWNLEVPETAAGGAATSGGAGEYRADMGEALGGIDKLGVQDPDPFGAAALTQIEDEQPTPELPVENQAPIAEDNVYEISAGGTRTFAQEGENDTGILGNDFDPDGDQISITDVQARTDVTVGTDGSLSVNASSTSELFETYKALDEGDFFNIFFDYVISDPSGATDEATVTIIIEGKNDAPTIALTGEGDMVYEAGLSPDGSGTGPTTITAEGSFTIADPDGMDDIASITLGTRVMTIGDGAGEFAGLASMVGQTFDAANGTVELTGYADGTFTYQYTLASPTTDAAGVTETDSFDVAVADEAEEASATVTIDIMDDIPTANDDTPAALTEDSATDTVSGNVLSNDTSGADTAKAFDSWDSSTANTAAQTELAKYGALTLDANGDYTFVLNNADPDVQALDTGDIVSEDLAYTMTDADGDTKSATLTITIKGADDTAKVVVAAEGADSTVYESGLNQDGSNAAAATETDTGSFNVEASDGISSVTVGGTTFTLTQLQAFTSASPSADIDTGEGTLVITGYSSADGDKTATIDYEYTLDDAQTHTKATNDTTLTDSVALSVAGVGGTSGSANLTIDIMDDVPTANDDTPAALTEDSATDTVSGNVLSNDTSGADTAKAFDSWGDNTAAESELAKYGDLTLNGDGTYSFVLNNADADTQALADGESISEVLAYTMTDDDGDTSSATLTITINGINNPPDAIDNYYSTTASDATVNIVLIVDKSGSMGDIIEQDPDVTRLDLVKDAIENLINTYDSSLNKVMVVPFSSSAEALTNGADEVWMSGAEALALINGLSANGYTDYDSALTTVEGNYGTPPAADNTFAYFLSDGKPTSSDGGDPNTIEADERQDWVDFLKSTNIEEVYAVGIGPDISQVDDDLEDVAWSSSTPDAPDSGTVVLVLDENDLSGTLEVLASTVTGNVLTDDTGEGVDNDPEGDALTVTHVNGSALNIDPNTPDVFDLAKGELTIEEDGEFSFVPNPNVFGEQAFTYTITDGNGESDTATVTIDLPDNDPPVAVDDLVSTEDHDVNIVIVIDTSGSMGTDISDDGEPEQSRLDLTKAAIAELISTYGSSLNKVMVVEFNTDAYVVLNSGDEVWMTPSEALTEIGTLADGGETDYDDALSAVASNYGTPPAADSTYVYFLSDGVPNTDSHGINSTERDNWETFLEDNNIDEVFAVGIGPGIDQTDGDLQDVAWSSTGNDNDNVELVLDEDDLSDTLSGLAQKINGNVLDNDSDNDGDPITVTEVGGQPVSGAPLIIDGEFGQLTIDPDGDYSYTATDEVSEGFDVFTYTVTDNHGQSDTGNLVIRVNENADGRLLVGTESADALEGGTGNDALIGGAGDDSLSGGGGFDFLVGDEGKDTFFFTANAGEGTDTITDFNINEDILSFTDLLDGGDGLDLGERTAFLESVTYENNGVDLTLTVPDQNNPVGGEITEITLAGVGAEFGVGAGNLNDLITQITVETGSA